jgi:hypothetical protein
VIERKQAFPSATAVHAGCSCGPCNSSKALLSIVFLRWPAGVEELYDDDVFTKECLQLQPVDVNRANAGI